MVHRRTAGIRCGCLGVGLPDLLLVCLLCNIVPQKLYSNITNNYSFGRVEFSIKHWRDSFGSA